MLGCASKVTFVINVPETVQQFQVQLNAISLVGLRSYVIDEYTVRLHPAGKSFDTDGKAAAIEVMP